MPLSTPAEFSQAAFDAAFAAAFAAALPWDIITFTGDRTLVLSDAFGFLVSIDAGVQTVTIPPNTDVDFDIGTQISIKQGDSGVVDFAQGAGVLIESRGGLLNTNGQEAVTSIVQTSTDVWALFGDLA